MKKLKSLILVFAILFSGLSQVMANEIEKSEKKTAETVLALADSFDELTPENLELLKAEVIQLSVVQRVKLAKMSHKMVEEAQQTNNLKGAKAGLYILAIFLPPVAVGIHTDWGKPTGFNVLWWLLGGLPAVIHAFIVLGR